MYNLIEVANTHGGSIDYLLELIDEFKEFRNKFGIKFQPFKYDCIALKDFEWYSVYEELYFSPDQWDTIITKAKITKDIWLDIFDDYGLEILATHLDSVHGLKLQSSVLDNQTVLSGLNKINISNKKVILNIAGRQPKEITKVLDYFEQKIKPEEILLEVGFQAFPTELHDSGLAKMNTIKGQFQKRVVFADHIGRDNINVQFMPVVATVLGADFVEKHVMHSTREAKYDSSSSMVVSEYREFIQLQNKYLELFNQPFINNREIDYLNKSIQIPTLKTDLSAGSMVSKGDIEYKRTNQKGLYFSELDKLQKSGMILGLNKKAQQALFKKDYRKAKVAVIIAARLKSTRLKDKALEKIGSITSIELCIKNAMKIKSAHHIVLATSDNKQDSALKKYLYDESVVFHTGDPDDVIRRYLGITSKMGIDIVLRVTGDQPYVSEEIAEFLLTKHYESGADYTSAKEMTIGTDVEVINVAALEKIKAHFPSANYSEYMTWYFQNNPEHFKLNIVNLPIEWVRPYRLTLDYQEDLNMFTEIQEHFDEMGVDPTLEMIHAFLDKNPKVAKINSHVTLRYKTDQDLIDRLNKFTKIN